MNLTGALNLIVAFSTVVAEEGRHEDFLEVGNISHEQPSRSVLLTAHAVRLDLLDHLLWLIRGGRTAIVGYVVADRPEEGIVTLCVGHGLVMGVWVERCEVDDWYSDACSSSMLHEGNGRTAALPTALFTCPPLVFSLMHVYYSPQASTRSVERLPRNFLISRAQPATHRNGSHHDSHTHRVTCSVGANPTPHASRGGKITHPPGRRSLPTPPSMASSIAGPSSLPSLSSTSFREFANALAESKDLTLADRLAADPESGHFGTAVRFAQVCSERAARAEGAEVNALEGADSTSRARLDEEYGEEDRLQWILEARTWELIHYLCADRYLHHPKDAEAGDGEDEDEEHGTNFYKTPLAAIQDILDRNRGLRELKVRHPWASRVVWSC